MTDILAADLLFPLENTLNNLQMKFDLMIMSIIIQNRKAQK